MFLPVHQDPSLIIFTQVIVYGLRMINVVMTDTFTVMSSFFSCMVILYLMAKY